MTLIQRRGTGYRFEEGFLSLFKRINLPSLFKGLNPRGVGGFLLSPPPNGSLVNLSSSFLVVQVGKKYYNSTFVKKFD